MSKFTFIEARKFPLADPLPESLQDELPPGVCTVFARPSGETRPPRKGEWYLSGAIVEAYRAPNDLSTPHLIADLWARDAESNETMLR